MRVIAGTARGCRLHTPRDMHIRPTLDRVREALFNIIAPRIAGGRFLDLFAGTGANGIEALSRGAASATFVEKDRRALELIERNLDHVKLAASARVLRLTLPAGLPMAGDERGPYDVVFADPPYDFAQYDALLEGLASGGLVRQAGIIVFEHDASNVLPGPPAGIELTRTQTYGDTGLSFYLPR